MNLLKNKSIETLMSAITTLNTPEECYAFFEDVCTIKEMQDMAQRFETAILLHQGKSYQQICADVGASTATISRVNRCLEYGNGGYKMVIGRLEKKEDAGDVQ